MPKAMTHRERVLSALDYQGYDRPPAHHYGTPEINAALMERLGAPDWESMARLLGDDMRHLEPRYIGPELRQFPDGSWEGLWGERYMNYCFGGGTYPETCFLPFENMEDVAELANHRFPSPDWYDYSDVYDRAKALREAGYIVFIGDPGMPDFLNGIARCRGVQQVLLDVGLEEPVFLEIARRRYEFFREKIRRTLEAAKGLIDIVGAGEDLGTQNGLTISPRSYDALFADYMKDYFGLAHSYGARTMMHSCGSVRRLIPRLIELGLDILEVVQVDAAEMAIEDLHAHFYKKIAFCGSISVQHTLPHGTIDEVVAEVEKRKRLFADGGMIIAPTHDIQVGTPLDNILAMYQAIGSLDPRFHLTGVAAG